MDPYNAQRLINEVIYLHALWHQGPPRPPPQAPLSNYPPSVGLLHYPSNHTQFYSERSKRKRNEEDSSKESEERNQTQGKEWPCKLSSNVPPATTSDWNKAWPKLNSEPFLLSDQEKAKLAASQAQFKALKVAKDYFFTSDDENQSDDDDDDDDDDFMEEDDGCEEYGFFVKLFAEDNELREYHEKNYKNAELFCLVCGGLGKKLAGKKYKGCISLVQHSISIARTKKRRAHRAYGKVICKILGWDIDNLSSIVSAMAENREQPLNKSDLGDAEALKNDGDAPANVEEENKDDSVALESKEGSTDVTNSAEGETQAIIDEGAKDDSSALEYKEGSVHVTTSGQGDAGCDSEGKVEAIVGEGTEDSATIPENKEALVDACSCSILPADDSFSVGNLENNSESTFSEQNPTTAATASKTADDYNLTVPVVVEGKETEMLGHHVEPYKDGCIDSDEGKDSYS